jgi:peptidyl-prolyl cis-trans isomerase B (cyclophilin B)
MLRAEINDEPMTTGAVAAVLVPNRRDSGGAQFFVCANDQKALEGQYTIFGRVVDGIDVVNEISAVPAKDSTPEERIAIKSVTIRDAAATSAKKDPFGDMPIEELVRNHAVLETTKGEIEIEFLTDKAPETVRQFLRLAAAGVYDGTPFHRVIANFVIQGGAPAFRDKPLTISQNALIRNLQPEFSDIIHMPGIVSMARGEALDSATTSFFVCTGDCRPLDGQYTAFGRVVRGIRGMETVNAIAAAPVDGEAPKDKIVVTRVRIVVR